MRNPYRLLGAAVVFGSAAICACLTVPMLSTTSQSVTVVMPQSHDFGVQPLGAATSYSPFTVSPQGPMDDDVIVNILLGSCPDFSIQAPGIGSGSNPRVYNLCTGSGSGSGTATGAQTCNPVTYSFGATFKPSSVGPQSCVAVITTMPTAGGALDTSQTVTLFGSGMGNTYMMSVLPSALHFGGLAVNTTSMGQVITVQNTGSTSITVTPSAHDTGGAFVITPTMPVPVTLSGMGSSAMFTVQCRPPSANHFTGDLTFTTSSAEGSLMGVTTFDCDGLSTSLGVTPSPIDFGSGLLGRPASDLAVSVKNSGGLAATIANLRLAGNPADVTFTTAPSGNYIIGPGQTTQVASIHYAPTTEDSSGDLGSFVFDEVGGSAVPTPIKGTTLLGSVGTNPATIEFGPVCAGGSAMAQNLDVFANGDGDVTVMSVTPPASPFAITPGNPGKTVLTRNHTNALTFSAQLTNPTAPGELASKLVLATDIPMGAMREIPFHAIVLAAGVSPSPDQLHFGSIGTGMTSSGRDVKLTNCGSSPLMVTGTHMEGAQPTEFTVVLPSDPAMVLQPAQTETFTVVMSPKGTGQRQATLVIDYAGGGASVALDGAGFGGSDAGSSGERETYYACSTGRPAAAWPIVFALLALRRRRR